MVDLPSFMEGVEKELRRNIEANREQYDIITSEGESIKVVAGPGSGKTTVIVLRILKAIYVEGMNPDQIMATTFTRKAASELKSRILSWGEGLRKFFLDDPKMDNSQRTHIQRLNFDSIVTGTIDSISESIMSDYRQPDKNPPILIERFVARTFMMRELHFKITEEERIIFQQEHDSISPDMKKMRNAKDKISFLLEIHSRLAENLIPVEEIADRLPIISKIIMGFRNTLKERLYVDFPALETSFLEFIKSSDSEEFKSKIRLLLIDEYQDTNVLQEKIYLNLGKKVVSNGGYIIVVGDDDQSIFRFRGSRVFLFSDLETRSESFGICFKTAFLSTNYRSSPSIVRFCNDFSLLDSKYQTVRVREKPQMSIGRDECDDYPIFGIFRDTVRELSEDLARLVHQFVTNGFFEFDTEDGKHWIFEGKNQSAADLVLLCNSPVDLSSGGNERLPLCLRTRLRAMEPPINVFNPRGTAIGNSSNVSILCGTLLECLDPDGAVLSELIISDEIRRTITDWRRDATRFIPNAPPFKSCTLNEYVRSWREGRPYPSRGKWDKDEVAVLDIIYNILSWIPEMHNDAEGMVYLESICRTVNSAMQISYYDSKIKFDENTHLPLERTVKELYETIIIPLADGLVEIDEELLFTVPLEDRLNIMSIHQSKGLEFPITIVDVSSDFKTDHRTQRMMRFPEKLDNTACIEDLLRNYSAELWSDRGGLDSIFDDIIRKYFVSFSRSQDVLILVGLMPSIVSGTKIKNIATGWDRDRNWAWNRLQNISMVRRW